MRFAIVFAVVFGLSGIGYAEDLAKKFENAGKPIPRGTEDQKEKERENLLDPIKMELQRCLKDETIDPSLSLLTAWWKFGASLKEVGLSNDDLSMLNDRQKKIGNQILDYLTQLGTEDRFEAMLRLQYELFDRPGIWGIFRPDMVPGSGKEPLPFLFKRGLAWDWLQKPTDRKKALERAQTILDRVAKHPPQSEGPPFCHRVWENELLDAAYLIKKRGLTAKEMELGQAEYDQWQSKAKAIAVRDAKSLVVELEKADKPGKEFVQFAEDRLLFLFALITPEEIGTTSKDVADLIKRKRAALH